MLTTASGRVHRKFLVVGAGRSGTKYVAYLLQALGLDIGHETAGLHGIVSWYLAADADSVPDGPPSSQFVFEHVFHQVRHPLRAIPSLATLRADTWSFVARHTPCSLNDPLPVRCAKLWLHWNEMAEAKAEWRYRIEDLPLMYEDFCERFGVRCDHRALDRLPRDINTRPPHLEAWVYRLETRDWLRRSWLGDRLRKLLLVLGGAPGKPAFTWPALDRIDLPLSQRIRRKAREYGYDE